jgi:hypothetical protein
VAKFGKDPIYRTKVIARKPVWMSAHPPAIPNHIIRPISRRAYKKGTGGTHLPVLKILKNGGIIYITRCSQEPVSLHLVIKRTNWSYVKTMSCSGSHLGIPNNIKNTKFVKDLPMIDAV